ncbi:putative integral membrane protein [Streptomyces ambofaciens ATCC 23877]|uniref:Putative integral membrane protein n=1 Tax=Streptomyces ambofaciens (strain ATCC 23877 / 3486 / DSM 40053 / JCM 4204 / NBRC 12836 / NRRL B-2516) TaxID=278992 RepID=A0ADS6_STRA7|nr:PepSY domain-containing protein [Streptomyces ambofaciens]AKZ59696.1 putative integral membrane protein [Streptomyces ambofaciens ATCC 23877]CAJ88633.1 putative integral membrane protein [Streptomyces ambofaciens ATCC 23877]
MTATTSPPATDEAPDRAAPPPPGTWAPLRPLVLRLHFYAGLFVAPFLLVAAATGFLYAASFQAEKLLYAHELTVPDAGERKLPVSEQVAAARQAHPDGTVSAVRPSPDADATTRVLLSGVEGVDPNHTLAVFVDPYTAKVRGALEQYGSSGALPLRTWIDEFHRDLHLGEPGRLYSEFAASWLWVIAGGGLVLWFSRRRARRKLRGTRGRRRSLGLHGTVGAWVAAGFVFLSATGLTWSTYAGANIEELRVSLGQTTPSVSASAAGGGEHAGHGAAAGTGGDAAHGVGLDKVLAAARGEGLSDPVEIVPPADASSAYVVKQVQRSWPEKQDSVAIDPVTGEVTDVLRFADYPVLAKLSRWGIDLHTGSLFGLANQIGLMALAAALILLIVLGYRMWWQRGRGSVFGRPVPRGAWQQVPPAVLVPLLAAVAVLGYFVPLLGVPLAVFVAVDVVLGEIAHRRGRRTYAGGTTAKR